MFVRCKIPLCLEHWPGIQAIHVLAWLLPGRLCSGDVLQGVFWFIFFPFLLHLSSSQCLSAPWPPPTVKLGHQHPSVLTSAELQEPEYLLSCLVPWKPLHRELEGHGSTLLWWSVPQASPELAAKSCSDSVGSCWGHILRRAAVGMWEKTEGGFGYSVAPRQLRAVLALSWLWVRSWGTCTRLNFAPQFPAPGKEQLAPLTGSPKPLLQPSAKVQKVNSFLVLCCFTHGIWGFQLGWAVRGNEEILSLSVFWCLLPLWLCTVGTAVISAPRCSQAPLLKQAFRWHSRACVFVFLKRTGSFPKAEVAFKKELPAVYSIYFLISCANVQLMFIMQTCLGPSIHLIRTLLIV